MPQFKGRTGDQAAALSHFPLRPGLELIIQNFRPTRDVTLRFARETSSIHFGYLIKGSMHTVINQGPKTFFNATNLAGRSGIMFLPHTISQGRYQAGNKILAVSVDVSPELFGELAGEITPNLPIQLRELAQGRTSSGFVLSSTITARMSSVLYNILSMRQEAPCAGLLAEAKALELLSLQLEQFIQYPNRQTLARPLDKTERAAMQRVIEMVSANLQSPPCLLEISREAGMSHSKLNRCFKQTHGLTVFEWLRQTRLDKAKTLLNRGCSIAEAALRSGFSDQSHLNRCFKRHFGITPGEFRRAR